MDLELHKLAVCLWLSRRAVGRTASHNNAHSSITASILLDMTTISIAVAPCRRRCVRTIPVGLQLGGSFADSRRLMRLVHLQIDIKGRGEAPSRGSCSYNAVAKDGRAPMVCLSRYISVPAAVRLLFPRGCIRGVLYGTAKQPMAGHRSDQSCIAVTVHILATKTQLMSWTLVHAGT